MSDARESILTRIRQTTRAHSPLGESQRLSAENLARHARGPLPAFSQDAEERFTEQARQASATVLKLAGWDTVGTGILGYLEAQGLTKNIVAAPSPVLDDISWPPDCHVERRIARATDEVAVSLAFAGVAETGTLALLSGADTPTTLNFLPDNYICILRAQDLLNYMEDVWDRIRSTGQGMPRTVNFITGPSRTADVEQTIQLGAHGPRRLLIVLLGG